MAVLNSVKSPSGSDRPRIESVATITSQISIEEDAVTDKKATDVSIAEVPSAGSSAIDLTGAPTTRSWVPTRVRKAGSSVMKLLRFVGPGFMVAVAYIDPGNYSTDIAAGGNSRFSLLFIVLLANFFAVILQSLAIRLGTITGKDLAQMCREHLPWYLNWFLYIFAAAAIIATDVAEVIGGAIALNLLSGLPLVPACAVQLLEVIVILIFYRPDGNMRGLKMFEYFMVCLVMSVVICFCIQLSYISNDTTAGEVFYGYVPSSAVVQGQGIYLSCGIIGATVMPHGLYLGSSVVKPRVREFDENVAKIRRAEALAAAANTSQTTLAATRPGSSDKDSKGSISSSASAVPEIDVNSDSYRPSMAAINYCLKTSTIELVLSLCIFALFVNSAILITAGANLYGQDAATDADLFGVFDLLSNSISKAAGVVFAMALLLSGISAGIVCTVTGQLVSEGAINWTMRPWLRQLIIRTLSVLPSIVVAATVGREGLGAALNGSQVCLSVILPVVSAPLVYFTCRNKYMTVNDETQSASSNSNEKSQGESGISTQDQPKKVGMRNHWIIAVIAGLVWLTILVMNVALLVFVGLGDA